MSPEAERSDEACASCVTAAGAVGDSPLQLASGSSGSASSGIGWLFDTSGFPARWNCGEWSSALGWTHILSDVGIWGAYMAIPVVLALFTLKRKTPLPVVSWLFVAFIASCGFGHLIEAGIFWRPLYRLSGVWKAVTAVVSWATVIALVPIIPRVLTWPTLADVNNRLRAEAVDHQDASERIRHIVDAAPVGMILAGADGKITMVNKDAQRTFGYSAEEMVGSPVEMLLPARYAGGHAHHRGSFFANPSARRMGGDRELLGMRKDGTEFPVDVGLNPIRTAQGMAVLATIVDMTQKRKVELELKDLNTRLEDKNAELEQFVYTASHDLKSPIVTILGYASHVLSDIEKNKVDDIADCAMRIGRAAERLRDHVDDLLELSRVGRAARIPHHIHMSAITAQVWESLATEERGSIELDTSFEVAECRMDAGQMTQLLQNLIENAIRYGCPGEGARIEVGTCPLEGGGFSLYVRDNGPGVPVEYRSRVFKLFERLSSDKQGTGVGLAIVRRVAEVNAGVARITDTPGGGATFWVDLPRTPVVGQPALSARGETDG